MGISNATYNKDDIDENADDYDGNGDDDDNDNECLCLQPCNGKVGEGLFIIAYILNFPCVRELTVYRYWVYILQFNKPLEASTMLKSINKQTTASAENKQEEVIVLFYI